MKTVSFITLGCRVNQYETQSIREELFRMGYTEGEKWETSDLILINTCAVTGESVRKSKQMLRRALRQKEKNPATVLCICGCYSQGAEEETLFRNVDVIAGNTGKSKLARILNDCYETDPAERKQLDLREDISRIKKFEEMSLCRSHNVRSFVKIQDGCNSFCSYCYVPLVRGRVRSRDPENVRAEVIRLAENGYREVVLTGIETGAYGQGEEGKGDLCQLVEMLHGIDGIERLRFGSLKPTVFTEDFCRRLSVLPKVMPHFHLSLQSGSDRILSAMRRRYGRRDEEISVENIYRYFPDAGLSADLICGFPGESEGDFLETVSLVSFANLLHTHIFPFSPRQGTAAFQMKDDVSPEEKKRRCAELLEQSKISSSLYHEKRVGKTYRVLCEKIENGYAFGYTENFIHTKTKINTKPEIGGIFPIVLTNKREFSVETMTVLSKTSETVDNFEKKL